MADMGKWVVSTSGDRPIEEVESELRKSGFAVGEVLGEIGCITGEASADVADKLRGIRGVADVEKQGEIDIGPPGAPETW
jgi:hypothetical protein